MATRGIFGSGSGYGGFYSANQVRDNPYEDPYGAASQSQYDRLKQELMMQQAALGMPDRSLMQELQRDAEIKAQADATSRLLKERKRKLLLLENV